MANFAFICFTWLNFVFTCFTWPHFAFTCFTWPNFVFTVFTWPTCNLAFVCFTWPHFAFTCFRYYLIFLEFETFFNPQQPAWIKAFNTKLTIDLERKYLPLQDTPMWDIFVKHFGKKKTGKLKVWKKVQTSWLKTVNSTHFRKKKVWKINDVD